MTDLEEVPDGVKPADAALLERVARDLESGDCGSGPWFRETSARLRALAGVLAGVSPVHVAALVDILGESGGDEPDYNGRVASLPTAREVPALLRAIMGGAR